MMPAISLTPLPPLPPFQFMPEPDLNFEAVLEAVPAPVPQAPAQPAAPVPSETLLTFLGVNPVKAQAIIPENPMMEEEGLDDETPVSIEPFSSEGGSPLLERDDLRLNTHRHCEQSEPKATEGQPIQFHAREPGLPRRFAPRDDGANKSHHALNTDLLPISLQFPPSQENSKDLGTAVSPEFPNAQNPKAFGLAPNESLPKPWLSLNTEKEDSTSTGSVRTEFGVMPPPTMPLGLVETRENISPQPTATPPADPLRFVVERQLDLARDSRWLDALARDIVAVAEAPDRLSFRLSPPQLGRLDVDLSASDSGLSVRMNASSEAATQIIAAAQPRLIDELKSQGVRVSETQVSTGSGGQSHGQGQQHQRDADQMIEYARARFERAAETNQTRPTGRFA